MRISDLLIEALRDEDFAMVDRINKMRSDGWSPAQIMKEMGWSAKEYRNIIDRLRDNGANILVRNTMHDVSKRQQQYQKIKALVQANNNASIGEVIRVFNSQNPNIKGSVEAITSLVTKAREELGIASGLIDRNKLSKLIMQQYDSNEPYVPAPFNTRNIEEIPPTASDMKFLMKLRSAHPEFKDLTMKQMLLTLKYLALEGPMVLNRNPGPAPWQQNRPMGEHSEEGMPNERFYDPMLTSLENGMVGMARNGRSNEIISQELANPDVDEKEGDIDDREQRSVPPTSIASRLSRLRRKLGIDIPTTGTPRSKTERGQGIKGGLLNALKSGRSIYDYANSIEIQDRKTGLSKTLSEKVKVLSIMIAQERNMYRTELEKKLGRSATKEEMNQVLPNHLKFKTKN